MAGKITDERFARMSERYEAEQKELAEKIKQLQDALNDARDAAATTEAFLAAVRKYTRVRKLTARMVNELIHHIEVFDAQKVDGQWVQRLTIHYNCVGAIEIPLLEALEGPQVTFTARKGVYVTYEPATALAS